MKNAPEFIVFFFLQYLVYLVKRVAAMDYYWQVKCFSPFDLQLKRLYLLVNKGFIPIQVNTNFAYGINRVAVQRGLYQSEFFFPCFLNRARMQAQHGITIIRVGGNQIRHKRYRGGIHIRQEQTFYTILQASLHHFRAPVGVSFIINMGMRIC